ncbi:MAG: DUF1330 domain-containing protein [Pseudomonadota bacterium]
MAKGYWIGHIDVHDDETYKKYVEADTPVVAAYGGKFLVRGGEIGVSEEAPRSRNVVIEFESFEQAMACYQSPEYQAAKKFRDAASTGGVMVIKGHDG